MKLQPCSSVVVAIAALLEIAGLIGLGYAFIPTIHGQPPVVPAPPSKSPSPSPSPSVTLPGGRIAVPPPTPKPELQSTVSKGLKVKIPIPPRAVPLCTVTGYTECDVYEDQWSDGHVSYHTGNCHQFTTTEGNCGGGGEGTTGG